MKKEIISPIAIDLGAKNTGVYFAHYEAGSTLDQIEKEGKVYQLDSNSYTYLMANRTAKRHQRRGYDRRQMAKRLFKLIWEKRFDLPWDKDAQQTISFLLNRRGFSFLQEEYDAERLKETPKEALDLIVSNLGIEPREGFNLADELISWTNEGAATVKRHCESICSEPDKIRKRLVFISRTEKLREYCVRRIDGNPVSQPSKKDHLSNLPRWILEEWVSNGIQGLPSASSSTIDLIEYLEGQSPATSEKILNSLDSTINLSEEAALKKSDWNFNPTSFNIEKENFVKTYDQGNEETPVTKTYLHHFAFALQKTLSELESGGRHRSKYFKEVKDVLDHPSHKHGYLKRFCGKLQGGKFDGLDAKKLAKLIGHISNLELKPLRKYFNQEKHRADDNWEERSVEKTVERWMLGEWRVGEKDREKQDGGKYPYRKLKRLWGEKQGDIVDFWLGTDPGFTIPPYQDNNNRRPPKCQTLLLNVDFLDRKYPEWSEWLEELRKLPTVSAYLGSYEVKLRELKSGKDQPYFYDEEAFAREAKKDSGRRSRKELDARVLQFILDRAKSEDPLELNEIYSHAKKIRQDIGKTDAKQGVQETQDKLARAVNRSKLPEDLKVEPDYSGCDLFSENSFLHLVCRYYKQRQRARDGRIFIQPEYRFVKGRGYENTGRFDDRRHLLAYCNHKPRQKRYQMLGDLAGVLRISTDRLKERLGETEGSIEKRLIELGSLRNCERAAKEQKDRRGRLKDDIQRVFGIIHYRKQEDDLPAKKVKEILKDSRVADAYSLYNFCRRAKDLFLNLINLLEDDKTKEHWEQELDRNPAAAVYMLAQINNIVFQGRDGNASTCAVCSVDNAERMQMVLTRDGKDTTAKSSRLPAIPTRLIDGAVMRMARIVGGAIAKDKWEKIKPDLMQGNKVRVPIITESNQFEFEPSLRELKGRKRDEDRKKSGPKDPEDIFQVKNDRIKLAGHGACPYEGESRATGEIDHIIPRASEWGTLNDEANLIWASHIGNHHKNNTPLSLAGLNKDYKARLFPGKSDGEITNWIKKKIWDGSGEDFAFGPYRSFINLEPDEQKAFRHALFLPAGDELRRKVINAIHNRNRTFVNGTQRYFAEVLANNLYKLAKKEKYDHLLSFDYFGAPSKPGPHGDSTYELRKMYEKTSLGIAQYAKDGDSQVPYSHLLDAQMAFIIAADVHREDGGLKLRIADDIGKYPYDKETGEIQSEKSLLEAIQVNSSEAREVPLGRKKPGMNSFRHRSIHRDTMYAEHYVPIMVCPKTGQVRVGFGPENSAELKESKANWKNLRFALQFNPETKKMDFSDEDSFQELKERLEGAGFRSFSGWFYVLLDVRTVHAYYIEHYNTAKGCKAFDGQMKFLRSLAYRTEKEKITSLEDARKILASDKNFKITESITLPVKEQWERLVKEWEATDKNDDAFLREFFGISGRQQSHEKTRKVFSLPVKTGEGKCLVKRRSWNGDAVFQIVNDSDSRTVDVKFFVPVFNMATGEIEQVLSPAARSSQVFLLSNKDRYHRNVEGDIRIIDPEAWHPVELDDQLQKLGVEKLEYQVDNNSRPQVRLSFGSVSADKVEEILEHPLLKPRDKQKLKEQLEQWQGNSIEYTGNSFSKSINERLSPALAKRCR